MGYSVQQIGITGPSANIGGSSPYHIDTKFSSSLPLTDVRDRFDALATKYQSDGRKIEFSNQGVAGSVYDLNASPEDRLDLLTRASQSHAPRKGWHSFDYYAPNTDKDRWHKSAEGAPIYVAGAKGLSIEGGSGGGYGNYAAVIGPDGNVISKSGHGDNRQSAFSGGSFGGATISTEDIADSPTPASALETTPAATTDVTPEVATDVTPERVEAKTRAENYSNMSKADLDSAYDTMRESDPGKAATEGMKMHNAYFGKI